MHSVLEGVVKSLFNLWFGQENHDMRFSLRKYISLIDARLLNICPPKFVPTATRSLISWKMWRAHEYLSFLMFYSLPIFNDIMDRQQFVHLVKLCSFMEKILSREIKLSDLDNAQKLIVQFVEEYSGFYGIRNMLSGVHELFDALVDCTKYFGPFNFINCLPFEELNRKVVGLIHGRNFMGEEFIKIFNLIQGLSSKCSSISTYSRFYHFIKNEMKFKTSNKKMV